MFSNQRLEARLGAGLLAFAFGMAGCSMLGSGERQSEPAEPVQTAPVEAPSAPVEQELTATEAAILDAESAPVMAPAEPAARDASGLIRPDAPMTYTVKRGDTLWDIASLFLRDPWLWPEIWYVNPQVENPHLIYPGDVLALAYGPDGRPQIRVQHGGPARLNPRLRSSPIDGAIPTIPYNAIAAFLSRPTILDAEQVRKAPHVVAFRDGRIIGASGHEVYVRNLHVPENTRMSVIHVGEPLRDPDDGDIIGYEGTYTATALVMRPGDVAKAVLTDSARETLEGDRLFAVDNEVPLNFELRVPRTNVQGRIISVVDGVELIGQFQIVAINRGKQHGLEAGHILAVDQAGEVVRDRYAAGRGRMAFGPAFAPKVQLPSERTGTLLVFKSFDRMSYGLIVGASAPIRVADVVRNP